MDFQAAPADEALPEGAQRNRDLQVLEVGEASIRNLNQGYALGGTKAEVDQHNYQKE